MANGTHRTELDRILVERGIRNIEIAIALKTGESTVSRWRSGVVPQQEATRKALVRFINRAPGFDPITEADLGWSPQKPELELYRERHPEKAKAHELLNLAVRSGTLARPDTCEDCGKKRAKNSRALDGHHEDYSKPLEVRWLCRACHDALHRQEKESVGA